jgi:hypothetical protein
MIGFVRRTGARSAPLLKAARSMFQMFHDENIAAPAAISN